MENLWVSRKRTMIAMQIKREQIRVDPNWRDDALNLELDYGMQTIAVRAGQHRTDEGEHSEAIFTTSSYVYEFSGGRCRAF